MDNSNKRLLVAVVLLAGALFLIDLCVPLGVSVWLPYVGVVLLSLWFPSRWQTYATAAACTVLILLGLILSPEGGRFFWMSAVNRILGVFALWATAVVGLAARQTLQLKEANRRLQEEIGERERLQAQLLRTQRLESVGVLASGIAHDFNNLLTPILMSAKLLQEDRPESDRQRLLETLQASAERGAETIRQLLSFAGGNGAQRATVNVKQIVKEVTAILEHTLPKSISIEVLLDDDLRPVRADSTQLSQVLVNLCVNARDAMPMGGALAINAKNVDLDSEAVRPHPGVKPGAFVCISVSDTGLGITEDVLDRIFDPFFTTKQQAGGTGLGLSTALGIIKNHGGFIDVQSEVRKGTRFAVCLPAAVIDDKHDAGPKPSIRATGRGELVLVVDDEPFILETAKASLHANGYRVVTAANGLQALDVFKQHRGEIGVVIVDMMMPGLDGASTIKALQGQDPQTRVIASSGLRGPGSLAETVTADNTVFLQKPYTDDQLLDALAKVFQGR